MKGEGFPWTEVGPGPEPRLASDFAERVIEKARATRAHRRRAKIGTAAGFAALIAMFFWMRATPANQQRLARDSLVVAPLPTNDLDTITWTEEPGDLVTVLMPNARQAAKFDAYYGTGGWDTYASWDPDSFDSSRTR